MTESRRIVLNTLATYGRSLFTLACSLFTSRWILMSLGHSDYGLFGVVGGLMAFIAFFNTVLGGASTLVEYDVLFDATMEVVTK